MQRLVDEGLMAARDQRPVYRVYLLRLWKESGASHDHGEEWRFSLESPHTSERYGFTSITALAEFLHSTISAPATHAETAAPPANTQEDQDASRKAGESADTPT
jgi:hypothetical protein